MLFKKVFFTILYLLLLGIFSIARAQADDVTSLKQEISALYPDLKTEKYRQIFVIHFNFCSSSNYCGQRLIDFIVEKSSKPTIVIYDTEEKKFIDQLRQITMIKLLLIPIEYMHEHGLFSVYNLWYRNKRKVKELI